MKEKKTIPIDELLPENDAGHRARITCPDCGEGVHIAEIPYWETRCQCREWSLVIVAEGKPLDEPQKPQLNIGAVRRSSPLTNQKLLDMAKLITDRQRKAKELPTDKVDWNMLEEEWFDWLEEELFSNDA